ncbi:MAG: OsmC family protein, partial [Dehalococcoidia bacterium]|nr:OsmC family protein [Dehalococcoidia bacterium]
MAATATVELVSGMTFRATSASGHTIMLDQRAPNGADTGPSPMELILLGLAGCTGMDVISILLKKRQDVTSYRVQAQAERAPTH